jgi:hypothetical protein
MPPPQHAEAEGRRAGAPDIALRFASVLQYP